MPNPDPLVSLCESLRRCLPVAFAGGRLMEARSEPAIARSETGRLVVTLMVVYIDDEGIITNVREQSFGLGPLDEHPLARWQAYVEGTLRAAPVIIESLGGADAFWPGDLFAHTQVLADASLVSADEFAAKLGDRERLELWNRANEQAAWIEALEPIGLADRHAEVAALRRPSLRLLLEGSDDDSGSEDRARTRFGGEPDLPRGHAWPSIEGEPLVFVAQFDLAELARYPEAAELPREGLLSCFYAPIPPEGHGMEHPVAVLHFTALDELERRPTPERGERLRPHTIRCDAEQLMPALESGFAYEALLPETKVRAFYHSLARGHAETPPIDEHALSTFIVDHSTHDPERPMHRLLGHPASIQGDPYLDVEMARRGWEGWQEGSDEALALRRRALGWRLLLQVDAYQDDELLLNQDGGFFYFWLPAEALATHDWSRARGCLQCH